MKKSEEIKKGLECCNQKCVGDKFCPYDEYSNACENTLHKDALVYIQQLEAENERLLNSYDAALCETADMHSISKEAEAQVPRWISVEERLPDSVCLAVNGCGAMMVGYVEHDKYSVETRYSCEDHDTGCGLLDVTHWMPLPQAPKEEIK